MSLWCSAGVQLTCALLQVGVQGDLWVVGAQNAGKSSLLNALKRNAGMAEASAPLTTAALPGTTLSLTPVTGLPLRRKSRCYDTPGVPHPYQYTSRLPGALAQQLPALWLRCSTSPRCAPACCAAACILGAYTLRACVAVHRLRQLVTLACHVQAKWFMIPSSTILVGAAGEDTKILLARQRALQPRTYRVQAGYSLWLGGLVCIDTVQLPAKTIYLTVWASDLLPLHLGKTEKAVSLYEQYKGTKLYPPVAQPSEDAPKTAPGVHEALGELQPLNVRRLAWPT